jgi:uncharacterized protein YceK
VGAKLKRVGAAIAAVVVTAMAGCGSPLGTIDTTQHGVTEAPAASVAQPAGDAAAALALLRGQGRVLDLDDG